MDCQAQVSVFDSSIVTSYLLFTRISANFRCILHLVSSIVFYQESDSVIACDHLSSLLI